MAFMKNNMTQHKKITTTIIGSVFFIAIFIIIFSIKSMVYLFFKDTLLDFINLGGDSDYYNDYALGLDVPASSIWPTILRELNEIDFYNRSIISSLLFYIANLIIPFLFASLLPRPITKNTIKPYKMVYWKIVATIGIYPSIFFYSLDIYRDTIMIFLTGISLHLAKTIIKKSFTQKPLCFFILISLFYLTYLFRPYLGFSLLSAIFLYKLHIKRLNILYLTMIYLFALALLKSSGAIDDLLTYRDSDVFIDAGSSLGINLTKTSPISFIALYFYSAILQFFGLYIISTKALIVFISESTIIIFCTIYIIKNRTLLTPFLRYLITFSIIYGTIWIIANDNLGTAVRLRIYNYLCIILVAASIYLEKRYILYRKKRINLESLFNR
jgi:hypothetical protein